MPESKIHRDAFLYLEGTASAKDFAQCGSCTFFAPGKRCATIGIKVEPEWSCGLYVPGRYDGARVKPMIGAEEAGLFKGQTRCENCKHGGDTCGLYEKLNETMPHDFDLDVKIKPHGCCNGFQPSDQFDHSDAVETDDHYANGGKVSGAAFQIPIDVLKKLGNGDAALGLAVLRDAIGGHVIERGEFISAEALRELGHGNPAAGRRILQKLVARIRRGKKSNSGSMLIIKGKRADVAIGVDHQ